MKEKILVALKTKYKTFGFGDKAFDGVADYLAKTVTEESQIETAIGGVEGLLKAFQGDIDTVRNEKSGLQRQLDDLKKQIEKPNQQPPAGGGGQPDIAKLIADGIAAGIKPLSDKLAAFEQERLQTQRNAQIASAAKKYGIPETLLPMLNIPADADLDEYMKDAKQTFANAGFQGVKPPQSGAGNGKTEEESLIDQINEGTKQIVEQTKK